MENQNTNIAQPIVTESILPNGNRVVRRTYPNDNNSWEETEFNPNNKRVRASTSSGSLTVWIYNESGHLIEQASNNGNREVWTRDEQGRTLTYLFLIGSEVYHRLYYKYTEHGIIRRYSDDKNTVGCETFKPYESSIYNAGGLRRVV